MGEMGEMDEREMKLRGTCSSFAISRSSDGNWEVDA
jgi:hypothetical protein